MSDGVTADADSALAEVDGTPVRMPWKGGAVELPPSIPAIVMVRLIRLRKAGGDDADVEPEAAVEMLEGIFGGADALDAALVAHSVGMDELPDFLAAAMSAYNPQGNRAARRAKRPAGRRSTS